MTPEQRKFLDELIRSLVDQGRIIEAGWVSFRVECVPADASDAQLSDMRMAFFGGAQHLFGSIMQMMSEGDEPTKDDERRMGMIDTELRIFLEQLMAGTAEGRPN